MALWKKKGAVIDLTGAAAAARCPSCGGEGSADYVDLVLQKTSYTCRRCAVLWDSAPSTAEHVAL